MPPNIFAFSRRIRHVWIWDKLFFSSKNSLIFCICHLLFDFFEISNAKLPNLFLFIRSILPPTPYLKRFLLGLSAERVFFKAMKWNKKTDWRKEEMLIVLLCKGSLRLSTTLCWPRPAYITSAETTTSWALPAVSYQLVV